LRGNSITVKADTVVLAAGGIENARILLTSNGSRGRAVGNEHDLVGRYFFDHLHLTLGVVRTARDGGEYYQLQRRGGTAVRRGLVPTASARRQSRTLGFAVTLHNARDPHDIVSLGQRSPAHLSLQALAAGIRGREWPEHGLHHVWSASIRLRETCHYVFRRFVKPSATSLLIGCRAEQVPTPDSRVTLDRSRDRFGVPRVRLDWRVSNEDLASLTRAQAMIADAMADGSVHLFHLGGDARPAPSICGGAHHMGTTRMARDPREGVVDEHGRVHSVRNLYVAGSSVFPTGGWAPPTLTIVALGLRLAGHLVTNTSQPHATA
jgi:choline dehydrogenase-like flavoprotein